jgi:hypothetical protein
MRSDWSDPIPKRSGANVDQGVGSKVGKGADMTEKSPRKASAKKSGKSLKRQDKKDKAETKKGLNL